MKKSELQRHLNLVKKVLVDFEEDWVQQQLEILASILIKR